MGVLGYRAFLTGIINTSFLERLNLTLREGVSRLARRTLGLAQYTPELVEHLFWWLAVAGRRESCSVIRSYRERD